MKINSSLIAPVVIAMIAPTVNAAELNLDGVNQYSTSEQVTSITQFSDVRPTDWAYQALSNLVERYGCVAGYPDGTYRGGRAMTRYEAAALLNACLDRVTEVTDELRALQEEFKAELIVLRGRVDGLESKVAVLEAQQFSTTTKLSGEVNFVLGGVPDYRSRGDKADGTAFNYDVRLNFDTSFTGSDLLRTRLRAGNFSDRPFGSSSSLFKLDKAETTDSSVEIDRLYYQFPVGSDFTVTVGPKVRNTEMAWVPSVYQSGILDFFTTAGAPGVYNKAVGAGVGVEYEKNGFVAGLNYVAQNGDSTESGVFDSSGALNLLAQVGYRQDNWGVGVGYRWFVGLQWDDAFVAGNSAGVAVGQPANAEGLNDALMLEVFYKYQVTDNISVTPAVFYVSNDAGQRGNASEWGAVVQTTFRF
jgi:hypothetical protein